MSSRNVVLIGLLVFSSIAYISLAFQKTVEIDLVSKWPTPLIAEISEYFAKKGNQNFWSFVESLQGDFSDQDDKATYDELITRASKLLLPSELSFLKLSTSIRYFSPLVYTILSIGKEKAPEGCEMFVEVGGSISCEHQQLRSLIQEYTPGEVMTLEKDHQFPANHNEDGKVAVLYGRLGTPSFHMWHSSLKEISSEGSVNYVFRHHQEASSEKVSLSGYGVELAIKNTEYKATDDSKINTGADLIEKDKLDIHGFNFSTLKNLHSSSTVDLDNLRIHMMEASNQMTPLKVWQLQDLSLQAAVKILSAEPSSQLTHLRDLSQNFPSRARQLVNVKVKEDFTKAIKDNQMYLQETLGISAGDDYLLVNGLKVSIDQLDMFSLVDLLQSEDTLVSHVVAISSKYQVSSLHDLIYFEHPDASASMEFGLDIRTQAVLYINDLEKDRQYLGWPASVQDLLRPTFPGMLRHLRKNLFNLVFLFDPLHKKSLETLALIESFFVHSVPVRVGFVFVVDEGRQEKQAGVYELLVESFCYINTQNGPTQALAFFKKIKKHEADDLTESLILEALSTYLTIAHINSIVNKKTSCYDIKQSTEKYKNSGLSPTPKVLLNGVPMSDEDMQGDFEESIIKIIFQQTSELQRDVYSGKLTDSVDLTDHLMSKPNINTRLNTHIFNSALNYLHFDHSNDGSSFTTSPGSAPAVQLSHFYSYTDEFFTETMASNLKYLCKSEEENYHLLTWWVVADLDTAEGRSLYSNALKHLKHSKKLRIALIHNPSKQPPSHFSLAIETALNTLPHNVAKNLINKLLREENAIKLVKGEATVRDFTVGNMDVGEFVSRMDDYTALVSIHALFSKQVLKFSASEKAVVSNGKIYGPFSLDMVFIEQDFELMEKLAINKFTETVEKHMKSVKNLVSYQKSNLCMKLESIFLSSDTKQSRQRLTFSQSNITTIHLTPPPPQQASLNVVAILDPASKGAQKIVPIIMVLNELFNMEITIFFNCQEKLSEMPLKSYYRFVLESEVMFKDSSLEAFTAHFADLPHQSLLTLNMHTPDSWLVESVYSPYDLDNILLSEAETNVYGQFELDKVLLEGHCYDLMTGNPPRGLEITLARPSENQLVDTIVMANLGYFQLKASPGLWFLSLRQGKSSDLYDLTSVDDKATASQDVLICMDSFKGKILQVKVNKMKGRELEDLLSDDEDESFGLWKSFSSSLGGGTKSSDDEQINVFSLASGHLYERFLRVMMLSVLKNTKSPVKFWFLKNYLSPSFKDFIPHMATKYGFQYELVQYKWPRWLHQQTEKQRMIWGYKILFLDVLFPLNVSKIIFVDADQTVRADLKELNDLDLEGAPYGYTPFCESRKEMDGYRFWKTGYWASHLGFRKYHISALYVVDLKKFRKIAAGDRLRGQYQGLSQDPNSLSNLDQDLPNNMIHQVAIKSLPQEWLWCETWCSNDDKASAKTIDLCNNPKTKEPKLDAALRIVSEWKDNDAEIRQLLDSVNKIKAGDEIVREEEKIEKEVKDENEIKDERAEEKDDIHTEL